jgi:polysaccharide deacetylase 2 family uncharacterized protein YibQ
LLQACYLLPPGVPADSEETVSLGDASPAAAPARPLPIVPVDPPVKPAVTSAGMELPRWRRYAIPAAKSEGKPIITIVIDDLGVVHHGTARALALPAPITLSWFPFARHLPEQVGEGLARGHEATMHMPMQSSFGHDSSWVGPDPLRVDLPPEVNLARLRAAIETVPETVGLNNHMGCVATRDPALMELVAQETKRAGMLFLDSVTIPHSVAYERARNAGVPAAARDIFIDHLAAPSVIRAQLAQIESTARRRGHVIAIGHPWPHTLDALEEWMPTLQAKGFVLWPLSATVALRNELLTLTA